jgi:IS66 Orf2 like protein
MIGPIIGASGTTQILVATKPVDFRKQADSLAALVQEALGADPFLCVGRDSVAEAA